MLRGPSYLARYAHVWLLRNGNGFAMFTGFKAAAGRIAVTLIDWLSLLYGMTIIIGVIVIVADAVIWREHLEAEGRTVDATLLDMHYTPGTGSGRNRRSSHYDIRYEYVDLNWITRRSSAEVRRDRFEAMNVKDHFKVVYLESRPWQNKPIWDAEADLKRLPVAPWIMWGGAGLFGLSFFVWLGASYSRRSTATPKTPKAPIEDVGVPLSPEKATPIRHDVHAGQARERAAQTRIYGQHAA